MEQVAEQATKQKKRSWSYSALKLYEQCAFKYKCNKIDKIPDPPSYAVLKGFEAHEKAEAYLKDDGPMVQSMSTFAKEFMKLKKLGATSERGLVLADNWSVLGEDDAWLHDDAWLRLKIDASLDNLVIDFKTGKQYDDHVHQGRLYGAAILIAHPEFDEVDVEFWYLNSGAVSSFIVKRTELQNEIDHWSARVEKLMSETDWAPTKNQYCKYCAYKKICPLFKK